MIPKTQMRGATQPHREQPRREQPRREQPHREQPRREQHREQDGEGEQGGTWAEHVPVGRLSELTGGGAVSRSTLAISLIARAQAEGETCAWVQSTHSPDLFAPDLEQADVQIEALPIVRVPALLREVLKAAELLLRSGGFGVVVVDLSAASSRVPMAALARLQGLAREHRARVVFLTPQSEAALGSPIGVRVRPQRMRASAGFVVEPELLRDKVGAGGFDPQAFAAPPDASLLDRVVDFDERERNADLESNADLERSASRVALAS